MAVKGVGSFRRKVILVQFWEFHCGQNALASKAYAFPNFSVSKYTYENKILITTPMFFYDTFWLRELVDWKNKLASWPNFSRCSKIYFESHLDGSQKN